MYEMFKKYELPDDWHKRLRDYADSRHVDFLSSAADPAAVDLLCHVGVPALKFASEDLINTPLLEYAAGKDCPVILSTGMADQSEIDAAVDIFHKGHVPYMLLHCVSLYPTPDAYANVARIRTLRERYRVPVGYSDHTHGVSAAVLSVAYGAFMIEKHFTLDRNMEGPDHYFSADPNEMKELVQLVRCCEKQKGDGRLGFQDAEVKARNEYRRSIVAAYDLPAGAVIEKEMLCLKRPGNGIHPSEIPSITGRRLKHGLQQNQQLTWSDLDEC
jgi:N-acetylneuraminate synthase/N,N'-diacetyllegionaminate synthase